MDKDSPVKARQLADYYEAAVARLERRLSRQNESRKEITRKQIEGCFERAILLRRLAETWETA